MSNECLLRRFYFEPPSSWYPPPLSITNQCLVYFSPFSYIETSVLLCHLRGVFGCKCREVHRLGWQHEPCWKRVFLQLILVRFFPHKYYCCCRLTIVPAVRNFASRWYSKEKALPLYCGPARFLGGRTAHQTPLVSKLSALASNISSIACR